MNSDDIHFNLVIKKYLSDRHYLYYKVLFHGNLSHLKLLIGDDTINYFFALH